MFQNLFEFPTYFSNLQQRLFNYSTTINDYNNKNNVKINKQKIQNNKKYIIDKTKVKLKLEETQKMIHSQNRKITVQ